MPRRGRRALALAAAAALVIAAALWSTHSPTPRPGRGVLALVAAEGDVTVQGQDPGDALRAGSAITTGAGRATVGDPLDAVVELRPRSAVRVAAWGPRTVIDLQSGELRADVMPRADGHSFVVRTPNARVTVLGTTFTVRHAADGSTTVIGHSGRVRVDTLDGDTVGVLTAGAQVRLSGAGSVDVDLVDAGPDDDVLRARRSVRPRGAASDAGSARPTGSDADAAPRARRRRSAQPSTGSPKIPPARRTAQTAPAPNPSQPGPADAGIAEPPPAVPPEPTTPSATASLERAQTLLGIGDHGRAIAMLEALPIERRRDALLGDAWMLAGRPALASEAYARAVDSQAQPPAALVADLAEALATQSDGRAADVWRRYLAMYPNGADATTAHLALARQALGSDRPATAEPHLGAAIDSGGPGTETALALLGARLIEQTRWPEAERLFTRFIDDPNPSRAEIAWVGSIRIRLGRGDTTEALSWVSRYRQRFPSGRRRAEVDRLEAALRR